jgi:septal ring factor EnvC (AmiA/AmiB activator)
MRMPKKSEARRAGLEVLSTYMYFGAEPAAKLLNEKQDPNEVYAITVYFLKMLGEYLEYISARDQVQIPDLLAMLGQRLMVLDAEEAADE